MKFDKLYNKLICESPELIDINNFLRCVFLLIKNKKANLISIGNLMAQFREEGVFFDPYYDYIIETLEKFFVKAKVDPITQNTVYKVFDRLLLKK